MSATAMYETSKRGVDLPQAKVTPAIVRSIRAEHAAKEALKRELDKRFSLEAIAARYGISKSNVCKITTYQTWRHVL